MKKLTAVRAFKIKIIFKEKILTNICPLRFSQFYIGKFLLKCRLLKLNVLFLKSSFIFI